MGQQNFRCSSRWRCFLPGGIPFLCSSLFHRNWRLRTHLNSEQKDFRFLCGSRPWSKAIFAPLHNAERVAGSLWPTLGNLHAKEISLWPLSNPCSWTENLSKGNIDLMTHGHLIKWRERGKGMWQIDKSLGKYLSHRPNNCSITRRPKQLLEICWQKNSVFEFNIVK